jgi:hypothetical protein
MLRPLVSRIITGTPVETLRRRTTFLSTPAPTTVGTDSEDWTRWQGSPRYWSHAKLKPENHVDTESLQNLADSDRSSIPREVDHGWTELGTVRNGGILRQDAFEVTVDVSKDRAEV